MTKSLDGILPPPKDRLEAWYRWLNHMQTEFRLLNYAPKVRIVVRYE